MFETTDNESREHVHERMKSRVRDLGTLIHAIKSGVGSDNQDTEFAEELSLLYGEQDPETALYEYALWVELAAYDKRVTKLAPKFQDVAAILKDADLAAIARLAGEATVEWLMSTGGPAEKFIVEVKRGEFGWDVAEIDFVLQGWYDSATVAMHGMDKILVRDAFKHAVYLPALFGEDE